VTPSSSPFVEALRDVAAWLADLPVPSTIIGGVAVIAHGVPRSTVDIDATVLAAGVTPEQLIGAAARWQIVPRIDDAPGFARAHQVLLLRHAPSSTPIDVSLAWLPFEESAIRSGTSADVHGVGIRIARAEDLVIYKLIAARPRDLDDAEALLITHGATMDIARLRRVIGEFAEALDEPGRTDLLVSLLARTSHA